MNDVTTYGVAEEDKLRYAISQKGFLLIQSALKSALSDEPQSSADVELLQLLLTEMDDMPELPDQLELYRMVRDTKERSYAGIAKKLAESLRTNSHPSQSQAGWRPIDTAPKIKKGPKIIIGNEFWTKTVFFEKAGVISEPEEGDLWVSVDAMWTVPVDDCTATHWRPNDIPETPDDM